MPEFKWLVALVIADFTALTLTKSYSLDTSQHWKLAAATVAYGSVPYIMYKFIKSGSQLGDSNFMWNLLSTMFVYAVGVAVYNETINPPQAAGILLGVFSLYLIAEKSQGSSKKK